MTAAERIAAAISKLEHERSLGTDGPWSVGAFRFEGTTVSNDVGRVAARYVPVNDAELIVTLHRTISAQLAILRACAESIPVWIIDGASEDEICEDLERELALADAILGGGE